MLNFERCLEPVGAKHAQAENHLQSLGGKTEDSGLGDDKSGEGWEGPETSFKATETIRGRKTTQRAWVTRDRTAFQQQDLD